MNLSHAGFDRPAFVILGLGNVGPEYHQSRHNIGFDVIDALADRLQLEFSPGPGNYYVAGANKPEGKSWWRRLFGKTSPNQSQKLRALLFKPTTFMNRSGDAAQQILERYGYSVERMLVVTDDFHLSLGSIRLRESGSDGGHNGLASIIQRLGSDNFPRLRVGIGPKPPNSEIIKFVLSRFDQSEAALRAQAVEHAASACLHLIHTEFKNPLAETMSKYNIVAPDPAPGSGAGEASQ